MLLDFRRQHARQQALQVVGQLVDHRIIADVDPFLVRQVARLLIGPDVEADDDRVRRLSQRDVRFGDAADAAVQEAYLHLVGRQRLRRADDRLERALHIRLDNRGKFRGRALLDGRQHLLERAAAGGGGAGVANLPLAESGDVPGARFRIGDGEFVASLRCALQAQHLHRLGRPGLVDVPAVVVDQRAHPTPFGAGDEDIADPQRAAFHQDRRHRPAPLFELRLNYGAVRRPVRVGGELEQLALQQDRLDQLVQVGTLGRGDLDRQHVAAHSLVDNLVLQQILADPVGIGVRPVAFVDGDDDRHARRLGVVDRLGGLRHHRIVGRHHQDNDVGDRGAAGAHLGERFVAGGVDEGDLLAARHRHLIGADMLGDAAGLARRHVGLAQGVEQRCLAVVDVAHHRDDRRARAQRLLRVALVDQANFDVGFRDPLHPMAELGHDQLGGVGVDRLIDVGHDAHFHQRLDHVGSAFGHAVGQLADADALGHHDVADHTFRRLRGLVLMERALLALLAAPESGQRMLPLALAAL